MLQAIVMNVGDRILCPNLERRNQKKGKNATSSVKNTIEHTKLCLLLLQVQLDSVLRTGQTNWRLFQKRKNSSHRHTPSKVRCHFIYELIKLNEIKKLIGSNITLNSNLLYFLVTYLIYFLYTSKGNRPISQERKNIDFKSSSEIYESFLLI